jgi:hypothetical protein
VSAEKKVSSAMPGGPVRPTTHIIECPSSWNFAQRGTLNAITNYRDAEQIVHLNFRNIVGVFTGPREHQQHNGSASIFRSATSPDIKTPSRSIEVKHLHVPKVEVTTDQGPPIRSARVPGERLANAFRLVFTRRAFGRVIGPVIADAQLEYSEQLSLGYRARARWIEIRMYGLVSWNVLRLCIPAIVTIANLFKSLGAG